MQYINATEKQDIINGIYANNTIKEISIIKTNIKFDLLNTKINMAALVINNKAALYFQEDYYEPIIAVIDKMNIERVFDEIVKQKVVEIENSRFFDFYTKSKCDFIFKDSLNDADEINEENFRRTR